MTSEEKRELGQDELVTLRAMWARWLQRDILWASEVITQGKELGGDWDFLIDEWKEKFHEWLYPYLKRLYETEYLTEQEIGEFGTWAYGLMPTALDAIKKLEVEDNG